MSMQSLATQWQKNFGLDSLIAMVRVVLGAWHDHSRSKRQYLRITLLLVERLARKEQSLALRHWSGQVCQRNARRKSLPFEGPVIRLE
jgi:hypothetical protein